MIIFLTVGLIKKICSGRNLKVALDLSNYATKADLKVETGVDTSNLAAKSQLAHLKAEVDKIDIGKLKTAALRKLSNVVDNVIKKNCE